MMVSQAQDRQKKCCKLSQKKGKKKWEELKHPLDEAGRAPPPFELAMCGH